MAAPEEQFLSTEEVAERLQVDEQTVRRWIKSGKLKAVKPGREWRIPPAAFEALLENHGSPKAKAPSPQPSEEANGAKDDLDEFRQLLTEAGAKTSHLALPEEEFKSLWQGQSAERRSQINQELLEECRLIKPLLTRWVSMPASKERSLLHHLWEQIYFVRLFTAVGKNQEAAQLEAEAARRAGDEARAREVLNEAEEFAKAA